MDKGKLEIKIKGRIDTLSAPDLLRIFDIEAQKETITSIVIDANELEYISSAGLRVILKMSKTIKNESVEIFGANQGVKDVFKMTGFDNFVKLL